ncbi:MAG: exodeoxyribonuclease VII small subunit [Thermoplasmata archaeon]|nr:exodeoxyribonuclease VII small subunit [Thermoplasmata archaeon]
MTSDMEQYKAEVSEMGFEASMEALEQLVQELEQGGTDLDRSLEIYERAVVLRDHCKAILDDGQRRIQKIIETADGIKTEDFDVE